MPLETTNKNHALIIKRGFYSDLEGIQTPNPQSRNLMRYSVAPRGLVIFKVINYLYIPFL